MIINKSILYVGQGPLSKSLLNRAWIVKSYFPHFNIVGTSLAEDVQVIEKSVSTFLKGEKDFYVSLSASALRFFALRLSREKGLYKIKGHPSLFKRPHDNLVRILRQVNVQCEIKSDHLIIKSDGWNISGDALTFSSEQSSQFTSGVLLNSFNLSQDLFVSTEGEGVSLSYLKMTIDFLRHLGMIIEGDQKEFFIPKNQEIKKQNYTVESDMSCLFSLACFAVLRGSLVFKPWKDQSLQPDFRFVEILKQMEANIEKNQDSIKISGASHLRPISINLKGHPDLFPTLAVLCSFIDGESHLYGVPHLKYKESNRIEEVCTLLRQAGKKIVKEGDGVRIQGFSKLEGQKKIIYNPKKDHRMAIAALLMSYGGIDVDVIDKNCINKSFPEFCNIIGVKN